jgi:hypothetical protein
MIKASFSYPQTFLSIARQYGMPPVSYAGEYDSWEDAFDVARKLAEKHNAPIMVKGYGMEKVFFPSGIQFKEA